MTSPKFWILSRSRLVFWGRPDCGPSCSSSTKDWSWYLPFRRLLYPLISSSVLLLSNKLHAELESDSCLREDCGASTSGAFGRLRSFLVTIIEASRSRLLRSSAISRESATLDFLTFAVDNLFMLLLVSTSWFPARDPIARSSSPFILLSDIMSRPLLGVTSSSECTGVDRLLWVNPSGVSEPSLFPVPKRILGRAAYPRMLV